jgi:3-phosphoshikimate 1-carboxyvinyltransferase
VSANLYILGPKSIRGRVSINLPGSKSIISRLLMMAALEKHSYDPAILAYEAEDTQYMHRVLSGIDDPADDGKEVELYCDNAGTVVRMASLYAALKGGRYRITGSFAMERRPVDELASLLEQAGATVQFSGKPGHLPMLLESTGIKNNHFTLTADVSSQHISGLLLVAPFIPGGATITLEGEVVSKPYIDLTISMMQQAGAMVSQSGNSIRVQPGHYPSLVLQWDADWSSAAFFYQAAAMLPARVSLLLQNLHMKGLQGDEAAAGLFRQLGVTTKETAEGIMISNTGKRNQILHADFTHCPDLFNAFATAAAFSNLPATLTGIRNLKHKESNRLEAITHQLQHPGFTLSDDGNTLTIQPYSYPKNSSFTFNSWLDHRVAASLVMVGLIFPTKLEQPFVTAKSFRNFYEEFGNLAHYSISPGTP